MLKLIRGVAAAALLTLAALVADAANLPQFTGPAGTNPALNPTLLPDMNAMVNAVNNNVAGYFTATLTPVATAAAIGTSEQTFTITGLLTTDKVIVNGPAAPTSLCPNVSARVSAANTLALAFATLTAAACTPVAGTYSIVAIH